MKPKLLIAGLLAVFVLHTETHAQWSVSGSNIYYGAGNVSVGTSTPQGKFQVYGGNAFLWGLNLGYGTNPAVITTDDNTKAISLQVAGTEYARLHNNGNFGLRTNNPLYPLDVRGNIYTNSSVLVDGGRIGINTTTPQNRLHIVENTNTASLVLESNGTGLGSGMYFKNTAASGRIYGLYASSTGNFTITDATASSDRLFINASGNIGINTHNVSDVNYRFFVEGAIRARKITVDHLVWPDTVFSNTYLLPPLSEIEKFILQNRHLPGVPSAAEVEKTGIDLGDNQAILLKKIEELTLYIIQQQKEIDALKKRMDQDKK